MHQQNVYAITRSIKLFIHWHVATRSPFIDVCASRRLLLCAYCGLFQLRHTAMQPSQSRDAAHTTTNCDIYTVSHKTHQL